MRFSTLVMKRTRFGVRPLSLPAYWVYSATRLWMVGDPHRSHLLTLGIVTHTLGQDGRQLVAGPVGAGRRHRQLQSSVDVGVEPTWQIELSA